MECRYRRSHHSRRLDDTHRRDDHRRRSRDRQYDDHDDDDRRRKHRRNRSRSRSRSRGRSEKRKRRSRSRDRNRGRDRDRDRDRDQGNENQRQYEDKNTSSASADRVQREQKRENHNENPDDHDQVKQATETDDKSEANLQSLIDDIVAGEEEDENEEEEEEDEQTKLERLREERRKQREKILSQYGSKGSQPTNSTTAGNGSSTSAASYTNSMSNSNGTQKAMPEGDVSRKDATKILTHEDDTTHLELEAHESSRKGETVDLGKGTIEEKEKNNEGQKTEFDMFEDDIPVDDVSKLDTTRKKTATAHMDDGVEERERIADILGGKGEHPSLNDNWDDPEGYLKWNTGEMLGGRYRVVVSSGKGVFSSVCICSDTLAGKPTPQGHHDSPEESSQYTTVALKVLRANDTMRKAGMKELGLLSDLKKQDPHGRSCVIRYLNHFDHRNHLCIAFEPMYLNIREVLDKFGKTVGINIQAVRMYAKQLLLALNALRKKEIIHADVKPHNILTNDKYNVVKLADFGSAFRESDPENVPTPLLVSRFYRSPEIILGLPHTTALDMWSTGCVLYEMYTGRVLFPGDSNSEMLWLHMQLRGRLSNKVRQSMICSKVLFFSYLFYIEYADDKTPSTAS